MRAFDVLRDASIALEWSSDGWMRSQARRWMPKATATVDGGWRELAPRTVSDG